MKGLRYFSRFKISSFLVFLFVGTLNIHVFGYSQESSLLKENVIISENSRKVYSKSLIESNIQKALRRDFSFLEETDFYLYKALDALSADIKDKNIGVVGSHDGWYESVLLAYGANPVVIVNNPIQAEDSRITYLTIEEYRENPLEFDLIINIASLSEENKCEDFYNLNKDLEIMMDMKKMLSSKGKLLLGLSVGPAQNKNDMGHVYGESELKSLFKSWKIVSYYGFTSEYLFNGINYLPIFLLQVRR